VRRHSYQLARQFCSRHRVGYLQDQLLDCSLFTLASWSLTALPQPWYDEGVNLQAAANLAHGACYGLRYDDAGALHPFDVQLTIRAADRLPPGCSAPRHQP
jgi:hypothetical protein